MYVSRTICFRSQAGKVLLLGFFYAVIFDNLKNTNNFEKYRLKIHVTKLVQIDIAAASRLSSAASICQFLSGLFCYL